MQRYRFLLLDYIELAHRLKCSRAFVDVAERADNLVTYRNRNDIALRKLIEELRRYLPPGGASSQR